MDKKFDVDVVFCDLDHTLVGLGRDETTPYNKKAIFTFQQSKRQFIVATGRSLERSIAIARELCVQYLVCSNGGLIYSLATDQIIHTAPIVNKHLQDLFKTVAIAPTLFVVFYCVGSQNQLVSFCWGQVNPEFSEHKIDQVYFHKLIDFKELDNWKVFRIDVFGPCFDLKPFSHYLETTANFSCVFNYSNILEINALETNKGSGATFLLNKLGVKPDKVAAFGDGLNDISMFELVKYGIAVTNATLKLKKIAYAETESYDQSGVGKALFK